MASQRVVIDGDLSHDLDCSSDLTVERNILTGLKVKVRGNASIGGDIQGSQLLVQGDLIVKGTIFGSANATIVVKGRVSALELRNARVECGRELSVEHSILDSHVKSKSSVEAGNAIEGGEVLARHAIKAKRVGASQGLATRVGTGIDFKLLAVLEEMEKEIGEVSAKVEKIKSAVQTLEQKEKTYNKIPYNEKKLLNTTRPSLELIERQLDGLLSRKRKLGRKLSNTIDSFIEVGDRVFPNTNFSVQNRFVVTRNELPAGKYTLLDGKICRIS